MKLPLFAMSLFATLCSPMRSAEAGLDLNRVLEAIAQCEGGESNQVGGRVCMLYGTWSDRAPDLSYQYSATETAAWPIFRSHLEWLAIQLKKAKIPVTAESLGTGWRWGIGKATRLKGKSEYGKRIQALHDDPFFK